MAVRRVLNENPVIAVAAIVVIAALAVWMSIRTISPAGPGTKAFYTDDDGKTWFADEANKVTPYTRDGKEVVSAVVYESQGKQSVLFMVRLDAASLKLVQQNGGKLPPPASEISRNLHREVKMPGEATWHGEGNMAELRKLATLNRPGSEGRLVTP